MMLRLVSVACLLVACKPGQLNLRGTAPAGADRAVDEGRRGSRDAEPIIDTNRPILPEDAFRIPEDPRPLEGVLQRRSDGGIDVGGVVAGVWDKSLAPVHVLADLTIPTDRSLTIKEGVSVVVQGTYRISVEGGSLQLVGTASEPVVLRAADPSGGWAGIRLCPDAECRSDEPRGRLEVRHARFEGARKDDMNPNDSSWRRGGALYVRASLTAIIEDSVFINNYAQERGGAVEIVADNRNVIFRRNQLEANSSDGLAGGALHVTHGRNLTFEGNSFVRNVSKGDGGAVFLMDSAAITWRDNIFRDNVSVAKGGAIRCDGHAATIDIDASNDFLGNIPDPISCDP